MMVKEIKKYDNRKMDILRVTCAISKKEKIEFLCSLQEMFLLKSYI